MREENRGLHQQVSSFMSEVVSVNITISSSHINRSDSWRRRRRTHSRWQTEHSRGSGRWGKRTVVFTNRSVHLCLQSLSQQMFKGGGHSYFSDEVFKKQDYEAFTEAFKDQFCPKKQQKKGWNKKE